MAGRRSYRSRKKKSLSRVYFLAALVLGFIVFKWGFSFLIDVIGRTGGESSQVTDLEDAVAPQTPIISALPEATNSGQLKVEGYTEPEVTVEYVINDRLIISEQTDGSGFYEATLNLEEGENLIKVIAKDEAGNESSSKLTKVIYDFETPEIIVNSPSDNEEFFGQQEQFVTMSGKVSEPEANLRINNTFVRLGSSGSFDFKVKLNEGENEIKFEAIDLAGNKVEKIVKVSYVR